MAAEQVATAPADGYTLLFSIDTTFTVNPAIYKKLPFDPAKDFETISVPVTYGQMLAVHPSLPVNSVSELVALAKTKSLDYASGGNGSPSHLSFAYFLSTAGITMTHIPYKGTAPAMNDILGGQVNGIFDGTSALGQVSTGKLRAIATAAAARHPSSPDVPTFRELGIDLVFGGWFGFFVPSATPQSLQDAIFKDIERAIADPEVNAVIFKTGLVLETQTQEQFKTFLQTESERLKSLTESAGASITVE